MHLCPCNLEGAALRKFQRKGYVLVVDRKALAWAVCHPQTRLGTALDALNKDRA